MKMFSKEDVNYDLVENSWIRIYFVFLLICIVSNLLLHKSGCIKGLPW